MSEGKDENENKREGHHEPDQNRRWGRAEGTREIGMGGDSRGKGKGRRGEEKRGECRKSSGCSGTLGMSWLGDWQRLPIRRTLCLVEISSVLHSGNAENRVGGVGEGTA